MDLQNNDMIITKGEEVIEVPKEYIYLLVTLTELLREKIQQFINLFVKPKQKPILNRARAQVTAVPPP